MLLHFTSNDVIITSDDVFKEVNKIMSLIECFFFGVGVAAMCAITIESILGIRDKVSNRQNKDK